MQRFSKKELALYNGKDGTPAYIAYDGNVYDATHSFLWQSGQHQASHSAGVDYTDGLDQAPHGSDLLERLPVVGILVDPDN